MSEQSVAKERLLVGYTGRMFLVLTLGLATVKLGRYILPPLLPEIIATLEITPFRAGIALSAMSLFFALMQYPSGRLADQMSRKTVLVVGLSLSLLGYLLLASMPTYLAFLIAAVILGTGEGLYTLTDRVLLSDLFLKRRGEAFGYHVTGIDISGIVASAIAVVVLTYAMWRVAFLALIFLLAAVLLLLHLWNREPYSVSPVRLNIRSTITRLFGNPGIRWIVVVYSLVMFTSQGIVGFLPAFLQAHHGFSATLASVAFALLFVTGLIAKPIAGFLSDRIGRRVVGGGVLFIAAVGLGVLVAATSTLLVVVGVTLFAMGQKPFSPVMQAHLLDIFPDASAGGDFGAARSLYISFGSLGPVYVGFIADQSSYVMAFAGLVVCIVVAAGIIILQTILR